MTFSFTPPKSSSTIVVSSSSVLCEVDGLIKNYRAKAQCNGTFWL
jgi:hypothetical protein